MQYLTSAFRPLQLGEVIHITGLPKSQVQNWTSGRPLVVVPTFGKAEGKGSRQLFALEDAYLFCFLNELKKRGLSMKVIDQINLIFKLWSKDDRPVFRYFRPEVSWLVVEVSKYHRMLHEELKQSDGKHEAHDHSAIRFFNPMQAQDSMERYVMQVAINIDRLRDPVIRRLREIDDAANNIKDSGMCECFLGSDDE
jgi:hypothetical protein